jgi:hypothetical protein
MLFFSGFLAENLVSRAKARKNSQALSEAKDPAVVVTVSVVPVTHRRRHSSNDHRRVLRFAQDDEESTPVPQRSRRLTSLQPGIDRAAGRAHFGV